MKRFERTVAVVTGGGSGIGREIGLGLRREGATVCLVDRDRARLETAFRDLGGDHERVYCYPVDITRDKEIRDLARSLTDRHRRIDVLIHSAGAFVYGEWISISPGKLDLMYKTNLRAPVLLTKELLPALAECRGQIVFINSSAGRTARAKTGAYSVAKFGLVAFADSLREEVNPEGIRVISVYPGRTATPMQQQVCACEGSDYSPEYLLNPEDVAAAVLDALGISRAAEVTDIHIRPMLKPK